MSVTFNIPRAPVERIYPYPDEPDFWVTDPVKPFTQLNVSNTNALALLRAATPWRVYEDLCGEWTGEELDRVIKQITLLLNTSRGKQLEVETIVTPAGPGPRMVSFGRDADYVQDRLTQLLRICTVARQHGFEVVFG